MARKIEVELIGDSSSLERALGRAGKASQTTFDKMSRGARIAGLAIAGGLAIAAKIGFDELSEMQKVTAQTDAVLRSTAGAANVTADHVRELAESVSEYSGADDEAVQAAENLLLTFHQIENQAGKNNDIFDQATTVTADLAQAMGMDLSAAALQVGKALNDPFRGYTRLQRIGVSFNAAQVKLIEGFEKSGDAMGAQKVILEELNKEFGGSAKAYGETMPGQLKIAQESFRNLSAELLIGITPALVKLAEILKRFSDLLRENPKLAKAMVIGLAALSAALLSASVAQAALNLAVLANPYVAAAVAIVALGAALIVLYKKFEFVRQHWQIFLFGIGAFVVVAATVAKAIVRNWSTIEGAFRKLWSVVEPIVNQIKTSIQGIADTIQTVINAVQTLISWIGKIPSMPSLPSPGGGVPFIPGIASGGDIARSGVAVVHKGERVLPARVVSRGGGGGNVEGGYPGGPVMIMTTKDVARWLQSIDGAHRRSTGKGILG